MSVLNVVVLNCDVMNARVAKPWSRRCVAAYVGHAGQDQDQVRKDSHRNGWQTASTERGLEDYCPLHVGCSP